MVTRASRPQVTLGEISDVYDLKADGETVERRAALIPLPFGSNETGAAPVGQVVLEGVLEVPPDVAPVDGAYPAPRPGPRPARTPLTWSVIRSVRVLFSVSA
jgi:hypothetical protein